MGTRTTPESGGIVVWDERFSLASLSASLSSYTEHTTRPGQAIPGSDASRLHLEVRGGQGSDLTAEVIQAGLPGDALRLSYAVEAGDTRWWQPPIMATWWQPVRYSDAATYEPAVCVTRRTGTLIVGAGTVGYYLSGVSPTALATSADAIAGGSSPYALVEVRDGLVLSLLITVSSASARVSRDDGVTWDVYSTTVDSPLTNSVTRIVAASGPGGIVALATDGTDMEQIASRDEGVTWSLVGELTGGSSPAVSLHPAGYFAMVAVGSVLGTPTAVVYRLSSAWEDASAVTGSAVAAATEATITCDHDGTIYVHCRVSGDAWACYESRDDGATWTSLGNAYDSDDTSTAPVNVRSAAYRGQTVIVGNHTANPGNEDGSVSMWMLGGWYTDPITLQSTHSGVAAKSWCMGYDLPSDQGWTLTGTAGTIGASTGYMTISTAGADGYYSIATATSGVTSATYQLQLVSGGSLGTLEVHIIQSANDGANNSTISIRLTTTGFRVVDAIAGVSRGDYTYDLSSPAVIAVHVSEAAQTCSVWVRRPYETAWTLTHDGVTATSAAGAAVGCRFGNGATGTAETRWWLVTSGTIDSPITDGTGARVGVYGYPLRDAGTTTDLAYLATARGPGVYAESYTIAVEHDYPVEAASPDVSPSPDRRWRSDTAYPNPTLLAWDLGSNARSPIGDGIAVYVAGITAESVALEYSDDGAAWTTVDTLALSGDCDAGSVAWARTGSLVTPEVASATVGDVYRRLQEGELRGGWIETIGAGKHRRIADNTAGTWVDAAEATTQQATLTLSGVDGTEGSSGSGATIYWPAGLLLAMGSRETHRYWRLAITPAGAGVTGYVEAGVILVGRVYLWGAEPDWEWSEQEVLPIERRRSPYGTPRDRTTGPPRRRWSWSWDGLSLRGLRADTRGSYGSKDLPYYGESGGQPQVHREAVWDQIRAMLVRTDSGRLPVVAFRLPARLSDGTLGSGTLLDPTQILYGQIVSDLGVQGVLGTEGLDEVIRIEPLTIEEIR